jgi:formyl-CoA transferase
VDLVGSPLHIEPRPAELKAEHPPGLGEHTAEVLREWLGLGEERVEELRREGVI